MPKAHSAQSHAGEGPSSPQTQEPTAPETPPQAQPENEPTQPYPGATEPASQPSTEDLGSLEVEAVASVVVGGEVLGAGKTRSVSDGPEVRELLAAGLLKEPGADEGDGDES